MRNIGVDIVQNSRFSSFINDEKKYRRILSDLEIKKYLEITNDKRKIEYLASRFAAKEAVIKAINELKLHFSYNDISILNYENGAPYVVFSFEVNFQLLISISHSDDSSIAFVVLL